MPSALPEASWSNAGAASNKELHGFDNYRLRMLLIAGGLRPQR